MAPCLFRWQPQTQDSASDKLATHWRFPQPTLGLQRPVSNIGCYLDDALLLFDEFTRVIHRTQRNVLLDHHFDANRTAKWKRHKGQGMGKEHGASMPFPHRSLSPISFCSPTPKHFHCHPLGIFWGPRYTGRINTSSSVVDWTSPPAPLHSQMLRVQPKVSTL